MLLPSKRNASAPPARPPVRLSLQLFVAGDSVESVAAVENLKAMLAGREGSYVLELVDVTEQPKLALEEGIAVTPTLVRRAPPPIRKITGDLSDTAAVRSALGLDG